MKNFKLYIFISSLLLIIYLVAQYNKPQLIDWAETLNNTHKSPFGTYVVYNRIKDIFPGATVRTFREPPYNVIKDRGIQHGAYIIIGGSVNINEEDYKKLAQYIENGNDVFIAASDFGQYLRKQLKVQTGYKFGSESGNPIRLLNKAFANNWYKIDRGATNGNFSNFDTTRALVLGETKEHAANYLKYKIGKGALYLNANPLMFSNYSLLQDTGAGYAAKALSHLQKTNAIVWDEYYTQGRAGDESIMRVFLRYAQLRWAFYIAFFSLTAFVLYEMKRRQRIIPVIDPLGNATIEFVNVVGQVYYEQRNNSNIAQKKATYLLEHWRSKYNVSTQKLDNDLAHAVAQKSGADIDLVNNLISQITLVRSNKSVSDQELIQFNQNIEQFNKQSR
ncbi:DUF4350 domain-containing protein [Mucilaginibacter galii]|uniref:DUF4350 domain-containing protein n=1 Tax=Mucilaginibacter galii TaxID=2005073 RepID=A0A917JCR2_9SPHI|nr:DUF4350 domain-containing protein [Mucilaginibacter galii]GGI52719.1 hypothetical protein GCM10011425_39310 [Mucilaginibacter galii]